MTKQCHYSEYKMTNYLIETVFAAVRDVDKFDDLDL